MATIDIGIYEPHSERIAVRASHMADLLVTRSKLQEQIDSPIEKNGMRFSVRLIGGNRYDHLGDSEGSETTVTINNPIVIDRTETGAPDLDSVTFTSRAAAQILHHLPNSNLQQAVTQSSSLIDKKPAWNLCEMQDVFQDHQNELRSAIREVTGHDGIVVRAKGIYQCDIHAWFADQLSDITRPDPAYFDTPYPDTWVEWKKQITEREPTAWDLLDHGKPWHLQSRDSYPTNEQGQAISRFGETTPNLLISQEETDMRAEQFAEQAVQALTTMGYPPRFGMRPLWLIDTPAGPIPEIPADQPIMDKAMDLAHIIGAIHVATKWLTNQDKPNAEQIEHAMGVGHIVGDKLLETYELVQVNDPDPWMIKETEADAHDLRSNLFDPIAETMTPDPWAPTNTTPEQETVTATQATPASQTSMIAPADPWNPAVATRPGQPGLPRPDAMQAPNISQASLQGPAIGM